MSPLGKYADLTTAAVSIMVVVAAIAAHLLEVEQTSREFLDGAAYLALGALFGRAAGINGAAKEIGQRAMAAHNRLDAIQAPPAGSGTSAEQQATQPPQQPHTHESKGPHAHTPPDPPAG